MSGWMRNMERRLLAQERRATDRPTPGFSPTATYLTDWNGDQAALTGFYQSAGGSAVANSPDDSVDWVGWTVAMDSMNAYQHIVAVKDPAPGREYTRRIYDPGGGNPRTYDSWYFATKARVFNSYTSSLAVTCTAATYISMGSPLAGVKKLIAASDLLVDMRGSAFGNGGTGYFYTVGIQINGADYDVGSFYVNQASVHAAWTSVVRVSGIPAGTYSCQPRIKNNITGRSTVMDFNDQLTLVIQEINS